MRRKRAAASRPSSFYIPSLLTVPYRVNCKQHADALVCRLAVFTALSSSASSLALTISCAARYKQQHPQKPARPRRLVGQARAADATRGSQGRTPDWLIGGQPSRDATLGGPAPPKRASWDRDGLRTSFRRAKGCSRMLVDAAYGMEL